MGFGYCNTYYSYKYANDILIAVRGKGIKVESVSYFKAYPDELNSTFCIQWEYIPENLRVDITVNNKPVTILGIRIKDLKGDYSSRKIQMANLMGTLKTIILSVKTLVKLRLKTTTGILLETQIIIWMIKMDLVSKKQKYL